MQVLGYTLCILGIAIVVVALIWSFIVVYRDNKFLAALCLFLPFGLPAVMLLWWPRTWKPLTAWALGLTVFVSGMAVMKPGQ
jgi:hypothetical protein